MLDRCTAHLMASGAALLPIRSCKIWARLHPPSRRGRSQGSPGYL